MTIATVCLLLTDFFGKTGQKALMSDGYNAYTFLGGELEKADHLICMAHVRVKFEKAYIIEMIRQQRSLPTSYPNYMIWKTDMG